MPLPKTASIAARATEVYSEAWSVLLHKCSGMDLVKCDDTSDLSQLLPYLRQLLTCCACAGLLEDAMISLVCGHCYCYECQFRAPLLKIQCRQCKERRGLVIETQIRLLVGCYKKMCLILASELDKNPQVLCVKEEDPANQETNTEELTHSTDSSDKETRTENGKKADSEKWSHSISFNPIEEILKEVQEGTKVSRAVLVIKPPSKYINARQVSTPKKESVSAKVTAAVAKAASEAGEKGSENKSPSELVSSDEGSTKKRGRKVKRQLKLQPPEQDAEKVKEIEKPSTSEKTTKTQQKAEEVVTVRPSKSSLLTQTQLLKTKVKVDNLRGIELEVSVDSLDNHMIKITSKGTLSVVEDEGKIAKREDQLMCGVAATKLRNVRFSLDKDGNRKRRCNPLSPRVFVRRSRASIDKMRNLQTKSVSAILRSKEKKKKIQTPPTDTPISGLGGQSHMKMESLPLRDEELMEVDSDRRLEQLDREHGLELPDLDASLDPDLELDATWLEELCQGIDEDLMYFAQPPVPPPPPHPMPFPPSSTPTHPPPIFGPPYSPQHHLPPPHHAFPPAHHPPHPGLMHHHLPPPPPHHFMPRHHPLPHHARHPARLPMPITRPLPPVRPPPPPPPPPPNIRIHRPTSPQSPVFPPFRSKHQLPVIVGKVNSGQSQSTPSSNKNLLSPKQPSQSSKSKKRRSPGYSESGWRCRCGTNNVMFPEKVCAKGKCPCYSKGIPCKNCLCKDCHNPFNNQEEEDSEEKANKTDETEQMESESVVCDL